MDAGRAEAMIVEAEEARAAMRRGEDAVGIDAFEADYAEMREALDWLLDGGRTDDAFRLSAALTPLWLASKRSTRGRRGSARRSRRGRGATPGERAAFATSATWRSRAGGDWPADERERYEGTLAAVSAVLSPAELTALLPEADSMDLDLATAFALQDASLGT